MRAAVFAGRYAVAFAEGRGEPALALVADGAGDRADVVLRFEQQRGRPLHPVRLHVRGERRAVHLFENGLERRCVHQKLARQRFDRETLGEMLDHVVVDVPDDLLLRRAPVYALFRAGDLHHLLYDLMQQLPLHGVGRAVIDLLAVAAGGQQAAVPEDAEVVGDGRAGHIHHGGDVHHALLAVA